MQKSRVQFFMQVFLVLCILQITISQGRSTNGNCQTSNGQQGHRSGVSECKPMVDFLSSIGTEHSDSIQKKINEYIIELDGENSVVCCPPTAILMDPPDVSHHENLKLLSKDCGERDLQDKITNGVEAGFNEFPWMTLLSYKGKGSDPNFQCAGTIITDRYILTAAHCLNNASNLPISVRIGEYDLSKEIDYEEKENYERVINNPPQNLDVEEVIVYPGFDPETKANDIGLLRVKKMNLTIDSAKPVCLPMKNRAFNLSTASGWGYTSSEKKTSSDVLLRVELKIVSTEDCIKAYEAQKSLVISQRQICAGGKDRKDVCSGDSGGPLHHTEWLVDQTRYVQHGIVSYGTKTCGMTGYPAVFTRVVYYMDWILDNLKP